MRKKILIGGIALMAMGSSLMAMGTAKAYGMVNGKTIVLSVEKTKIRNSGLKSGTIVSIGCEKDGQSALFGNGIISTTGVQVSYGKMDYERGNDDVSYLRFATYKQLGKNVTKLGNGNVNAYAGLKAQINLVDGLNNKGIGFGPYAGVKYQAGRLGAGIHAGVAKDWFEGGKFYTETNFGGDISYSF